MKNRVLVNIDGEEKTVMAEVINKKIWFKLDGHTYSYDLIDLAVRSAASTRSVSKNMKVASGRILAPMPGKVIKIFVSENQIVNKGDVLLVMEAMKMEYTLKADIVGTVEKIWAQSGEQVVLGHLLIQLKENKQ